MKIKTIGLRTASAIIALSCGFAASDAGAASFQLREPGGAVGQGSSFAGDVARADDPAVIFANPAGMARLKGYQVSSNLSLIIPSAQMTSSSGTRASILGGSAIDGSTTGQAGRSAMLPSLFAVAPIGDDWRVGIAVTNPWGLATNYPANTVQRYHALSSKLTTFNFTPSVSYLVNSRLSVGAGVQIQYITAELTNAVDFGAAGTAAGIGRLTGGPGAADGRTRLNANDLAAGFHVGLQYDVMPGTRVGLSYRSQIDHRLKGKATFEGVPTALSGAFREARAATSTTIPDVISLGVAHDVNTDWQLLSTVSLTRWSHLKSLDISFDNRANNLTTFDYKDSLWVSVGAEYKGFDRLTLRAGVAYDQTPSVDAHRTARIPDSNRFWLSVGATYKMTEKMDISFGYSHIFAGTQKIDLTDKGPGTENFLRGNVKANYENQVDILAVSARISF
jgi:long-chain fatty acid transport protein